MKLYHTYIIGETPPSELELLVQLISVLNHKYRNPKIPIIFATNNESLSFYKKVGILKFYDDVITDVFDDYPSDMISKNFWASPKLWLMKKINTPFTIIDTDLVLHTPVSEFSNNSISYLHKEFQAGYLRPHEVTLPPNWDWGNLKTYFKSALPINVSVISFNDMQFKNYYADTYFDFVLNNSGDYTFEDSTYIANSGMQTFAEQYLLSALILKYKEEINPNFISNCISKSVFSFNKFYNYKNLDSESDKTLDEYVYHLWGAKNYVNEVDNQFYKDAYHQITENGKSLLQSFGMWDSSKLIFNTLKSKLKVPNYNN
jgi:hypothetical protein